MAIHGKKNKRLIYHRSIIRILASDDTTEVRAKGFEIPGDKLLTGLVLKDLDEPVPGKPFDKAATITSAEGTVWDIPVFWIDVKGKAADVPEKGKSYMPLLVFFVPDGFASDGILTLPPYLSNDGFHFRGYFRRQIQRYPGIL